MPECIQGLSEVGIILIMFALGFEENTATLIKGIKRSWGIALFGAIAPFTAAYACALYFRDDSKIALMCGLTMTATAISLTIRWWKPRFIERMHAQGLNIDGSPVVTEQAIVK